MTEAGESGILTRTDADSDQVQVGTSITFFPKLRVAGVTVKSGATIRVGDTLVFQVGHGRTKEIIISSMEKNHVPIQVAVGPTSVGIWTGVGIARGSRPVLRASR